MAGVSWVAATTYARATATSLNATTPAGILDGDVLLAWVCTRSTLTPPAGWTLVTSVTCLGATSTITQILSLVRKDTVVAANSSTSYTWSQSSSTEIGVVYEVLRAESGVGSVRATSSVNTNNTNNNTITPASLTSDRGAEVTLIGATTILASSGSYSPTPPTGFSMSGSTSATNYRLMAAHRASVAGDVVSGTFTLFASGTNGGVAGITARVIDTEEDVSIVDGVETVVDPDTSSNVNWGDVLTDVAMMHALLGTLHEDTLADGVGSTDTTVEILPLLGELFDTLTAQGIALGNPVFYRTLADTIALDPDTVTVAGKVMREGLAIADTLIANQHVATILLDAFTAVDVLSAARPLTLAETIGLAEAVQAAIAVTLIHELGIAELVSPTLSYNLALSQALGIDDALGRHVGADAAEGLGIAQTDIAMRRFAPAIAETIGIAEALAPRFLLSVTTTEGIEISPAQALQMVLAGVILDGVEIDGAYLTPGGGITAWSMNTRTGAVTEYGNYAFNSFAKLGDGYIGTSSAGIYALQGDDDDGTAIIAQLKGGFLQFGSTHLSRLSAAYIAATGDEETFALRIETLDGAIYDYVVDTRSGRNTKVHMGKGQRARYFAYTLTSAGQDFTLDTLEFVPVVVKRRV